VPVNLLYKNLSVSAYLLLRYTFNSIVKCEDELFPQIGLTPQQLATLLAIKQSPEPVTQSDIANWLDRESTSITAIIDNLSKMGLVERIRDLNDRRFVRLVVTPAGDMLLEKARKPKVDQLLGIMSSLTEKETATLIDLLHKIRNKTFEYRKIKDKVRDIAPKVINGEDTTWPI
jgi:MarR family transcriptional regulator, 2-MHQ and catechol-resistance regulon repressor